MVYGIALVKDESDIIAQSVGWMKSQVDEVVVMDNGSTDGTREILEDLEVTVLDDREVAYHQSEKMTMLAGMCQDNGATWVVPFDADEIHIGTSGRLADTLTALPADVLISEAPLFDHVPTGLDPLGAPPVNRIRYRRASQAPLRKIALRPANGMTIHQGNHSATFAGNRHPKTVTNVAQVRHFPYRSVEQFVSKVRNGAAAYAASNLPESVGAHWRQYGQILEARGEEGIAEIFHTWFYREDPTVEHVIGDERQAALVLDPCPLPKL